MKDILFDLIDRFPKIKILVVGDFMLDRFIWGDVTRISPEAPVPVVHVTDESVHLGGSANVVSNICALGGQALPVGLVGRDEPGSILFAEMEKLGVGTHGMVIDPGYQTILKTRIIAHNQQVVRVDREKLQPSQAKNLNEIQKQVLGYLGESHALIISDYGKGVIGPQLLENLANTFPDKLTAVDPKDPNFEHYKKFQVITPNQAEAERMSGITITDETSLKKAAKVIFEKLSCRHLLITRGEHGMALFQGPSNYTAIPTRAREVYDVSGAGDTVISTYTLARAAGATPHQAALLANAAGGVVVSKLGTATLTVEELKTAVASSRWSPTGNVNF